MKFTDKLKIITQKNNSLVCVGLDSDIDKIPQHLLSEEFPIFAFNKEIIDKTHDLVCGYKPNIAFYEKEGIAGLAQLRQTTEYIKNNYPETPIILDAKRGDIGNTNEGYAKFAFEYLFADAITLHPFMGRESLLPFLEREDKGIFILCRTSNPGAGEFQDLKIDDRPLYQVVAENVTKIWNVKGNCGLVVGATYPQELEIVRHIAGDGFPILIPGVGTQGGEIEKTVKAGVDKDGLYAIINAGRSIIFAGNGPNFAQIARQEAEKLKNEINKYRVM